MSKYESKIKFINAPVEKVYNTLANLENLRPILDAAATNPLVRQKLEEAGQDPSQLDNLKDVQLTNDSISVPAPMIGNIALSIIEREENKTIKFQTDQSPVEANLWIQVLPTSELILPTGEQGSRLKLTLKADVPFFLKPMIGNKLDDGIDKFADMLAQLPYVMM